MDAVTPPPVMDITQDPEVFRIVVDKIKHLLLSKPLRESIRELVVQVGSNPAIELFNIDRVAQTPLDEPVVCFHLASAEGIGLQVTKGGMTYTTDETREIELLGEAIFNLFKPGAKVSTRGVGWIPRRFR